MRRTLFVLGLVGVNLMNQSAPAATVTFTLDLTVGNVWRVFAQASQGDNGGISTYGISLVGNVLTVDHRAPVAIDLDNFQPAGFYNLRSSDSGAPGDYNGDSTSDAADYLVWRKGLATGDYATWRTNFGRSSSGVSNPAITGGQSLTTPNLIYGFGQEASSFVAKGYPVVGLPDPTSDLAWLNPLLIAQGTYDQSAGTISFGTGVTMLANVFDNGSGNERIPATVYTQVVPFHALGWGAPGSVIPEPTSLALLLAAAMMLPRRRARI
jgi:hypothetical protein